MVPDIGLKRQMERFLLWEDRWSMLIWCRRARIHIERELISQFPRMRRLQPKRSLGVTAKIRLTAHQGCFFVAASIFSWPS